MKNLYFLLVFFFALEVSAQKPVAESRMELFGDHIFLQLSMDGSDPLDFIFDTGDGLTVVDTEVALQLELQLDHSKVEESAQGTIEGKLIRHNYIEMDGYRLEDDIDVYATSLKHLEAHIGRNIDGIIGYDLLQHYVVNLDYATDKIRIYATDDYQYTSIGDRLMLDFHKRIPVVQGKFVLNNDESLEGDFFLITGAATTVDFNTKFAEKNDLLAKTGSHYSYLVKGIGEKEYLHHEGRVKSFSLGKINYENMPIGISEVEEGVQANRRVDGIIGNKILQNFNLIFHYEENLLYLERHQNTNKNFTVNASGIEVERDEEGKIRVHRVYENTQAMEEGIREGHILLSIDGESTANMSLPEVREKLQNVGARVELQLQQGNETLVTAITLKELI
jgi:hypothetical protein